MTDLSKIFDYYSFNARLKPAFLLVFPIVISVVVLFEPARGWGGALVTLATSFGVMHFAASQMSTLGNALQNKLFAKWGGAPTTIILRHSDNFLDRHTKERYKQRLQQLIPNFRSVSMEEETRDSAAADEMYRSAAAYLREHTRDTEKYSLVFKENILYGFSRNLRAVKWVGLIVTILSFLVSCFTIWRLNQNANTPFFEYILDLPFLHLALPTVLFFSMVAWIFLVTEEWVKIRAFAYARALFAACETVRP